MGSSPRRPSLYRTGLAGVILVFILAAVAGLAGVWLATRSLQAQVLTQQYGRKPADAGPRALGLVQLSSTGKARIIPIAIMMNGKFYDAGSYKATPVPMALDFGVVYEAFRTGVSQGLFTITQPGQLRHDWIAEGTWLPAGAKPPETQKKYTEPVIEESSRDDRPVLHRRAAGAADKDTDKGESKPAGSTASTTSAPAAGTPSSTTNSPPSGSPSSAPSNGTSAPSQPSTSAPSAPASPPSASSPGASSTSAPASAPKGNTQDASKSPPASQDSTKDSAKPDSTKEAAKTDSKKDAAKASSTAANQTSEWDQPINDPNRPILRRGKPNANAHHEPFVTFDEEADLGKSGSAAGAASTGAAKAPGEVASIQTFAAISDAAGPDPRPYTYDLKPAEEAIYRNKMLDLAATLVKLPPGSASAQSPSAASGAVTASAPASKKTSAAKPSKAGSGKTTPAKQAFEDVSLRIFDLSFSNEPVLVLSARTPVPIAGSSAAPVRGSGAQVPASGAQGPPVSGSQVPQEITLIARTNLEGELLKLFFSQTDSRHLDIRPRMELIDAVDADGDGRGELLFRQTSDAGSAYAIYRVTADGLWPLYEGTP